MAKRKPSGKAAPRKAPAKRGAAAGKTWSDRLAGLAWMVLPMGAISLLVIALWVHLQTPRGIDPPAYPVVTLGDSPADAVTKSHARYLIEWANSLDEFADRAKSFDESGDAAKWFAERTAKARADAYAGKGGFDAYVFGHAGGTEAGEDRYDPDTLATGAKEMAEACRKAAAAIGPR